MSEFTDPAPPRTRPNYLYAILSVALVLFLLGLFGLLILQTQGLVSSLKEKINVLIEIKDGATTDEIASFERFLQNRPFTKEGSIQFVSKEEGAAIMREDFGEDFLKLDLPNPLYDVITFNVKSDFMVADSLENIRERIRQEAVVSDVFYQESLVNEIAHNLSKLIYFALGIGIFFIFVAVTLIHNTIRLALYANRFLIKNMELVGASWGFISRPYIYRSIRHGLISGFIAIAILILLSWWAEQSLPELETLQNFTGTILLFIGLLILGMLITSLSTYYVIKKYLKMRVDDLY